MSEPLKDKQIDIDQDYCVDMGNYFKRKHVASAVQWLKDKVKEHIIDIRDEAEGNLDSSVALGHITACMDFEDYINEAFPDVCEREDKT